MRDASPSRRRAVYGLIWRCGTLSPAGQIVAATSCHMGSQASAQPSLEAVTKPAHVVVGFQPTCRFCYGLLRSASAVTCYRFSRTHASLGDNKPSLCGDCGNSEGKPKRRTRRRPPKWCLVARLVLYSIPVHAVDAKKNRTTDFRSVVPNRMIVTFGYTHFPSNHADCRFIRSPLGSPQWPAD